MSQTTTSSQHQEVSSSRFAGYRIKRKANHSSKSLTLKSVNSCNHTEASSILELPISEPEGEAPLVSLKERNDHPNNNYHNKNNHRPPADSPFNFNVNRNKDDQFCCIFKCCYGFHLYSLLTIANVALILFLFQGGLGLITSFTLIYSTGQNIVDTEVKLTKIQSRYTTYDSIERFVDGIDQAVQHFYNIGPNIPLTNDIAMLSLLEYLAKSATKNDQVTYSIERSDGYSMSKEFQGNTPMIRIQNPLNRSSSLYAFPPYFYSTDFKDSCLLSTLGIIEYPSLPSVLGDPIESRFQNNSRINYKLRFESLFLNQSNPVWTSRDSRSISLLIPVYVNSVANRTTPLNHVKIVNVVEHPEAKHISRLFMIVSLRLPTESISQVINITSHPQYVSNGCSDSFVITSRGTMLSSNDSSCPFISDTFDAIVTSNMLQYLKSGPCNSSNTEHDHRSRNKTIVAATNSTIDPDSITFSEDSKSFHFQFFWKNRTIYVEVTPICGLYGLDWAIVNSQELKSFFEEIASNGISSIIIFIFLLVLEAFFLFFLVTGFNFSFNKLNKQLKNLIKLKELKFDENIVTNIITQDSTNMDGEGKQKFSIFNDLRRIEIGVSKLRSLVNTICKFVPDVVLYKFVNNMALNNVSPTSQNISVVRIQIEGLLEIAEQKGFEALVEISCEYFRVIPKILQDHGGMIDKLYDNTIVSVFNEESYPIERHEIHSVHAVLDSLLLFKEMQEKWLVKYPEMSLKFRASIHSGEMVCGSIGSIDHLHFSLLGKDFVISHKLLEMASELNQSILIGEETYRNVNEAFICYFVDSINLVGDEKENDVAPSGEDRIVNNSSLNNGNTMESNKCHTLKLYSVECSRNESNDLQKKISLDLEQAERAMSEKRYEVALSICERVMLLEEQPHVLHLHERLKSLCQKSSRMKQTM